MADASLRRLGYFVAVARERNFTRAAERLLIAQPALSRQVRLLERELGVDLLRRTTHQVELTEAGAFLLARAPDLLAVGGRAVASHAGLRQRRARAGSWWPTAPARPTRRRPSWCAASPSTTRTSSSRPSSAGRAAILAGLRDGSVDLGLVRCPPDAPDLVGRTVRAERQGVLAAGGHRLAERDGVALAELARRDAAAAPAGREPGPLRRRPGSLPRGRRRAVRAGAGAQPRPGPDAGPAPARPWRSSASRPGSGCPPSSAGSRSSRAPTSPSCCWPARGRALAGRRAAARERAADRREPRLDEPCSRVLKPCPAGLSHGPPARP